MREKTDIYEKITAEIIEAIEAGCGKFPLPWHTFGVLPTNAIIIGGTEVQTSWHCGPLLHAVATPRIFGPHINSGMRSEPRFAKAKSPPLSCSGNFI
jgi:hypothetical protein